METSKELSKKKKRRIFGRADRFLSQDFGKDIVKKLKNMANSEAPPNMAGENNIQSSINEKNNEIEPQTVLKNKRYEIKYSDKRVENFINGLKLIDLKPFLNTARKPCPSCKRNSSLFCPECLVSVIENTPKVILPIELTMYLYLF